MYQSITVAPAEQGVGGPATSDGDWRSSGRVLVIEDDMAIRIVLSRALAKLGFTATLAADGTDAVAQFAADPGQFVLALLDFKLPGMASSEVLNELHQRKPDLPVILTSGYDKEEALERSSGMEIASFLHKPFTVESLAGELRFVLGG